MTLPASLLPAILFEPDGYVLDGPKLMGRQAAGNGFLRAAIHAVEESAKSSGPNGLVAYSPHVTSAKVFNMLVSNQSPLVKPAWIPADRVDLLARRGAIYVPGPGIADSARLRLRTGPAAWSITGVTHTLCSHLAMDAITDLLYAPVMPWDALICTSSVAKEAVGVLFDLQKEYLDWRFGSHINFTTPQLPIIPLGIHPEDFAFTEMEKQSARRMLNVQGDEVLVLFAGRLSFHAKAHPYPMLVALQAAADRTEQKVRLLLCGQFVNDAIKEAFLSAAAHYAPSVKTQWVDGKSFPAYRGAWAASDIFVSLSDNLQETFGITPIEAMASGLPVVVSDWDGYKDTVVDGETGFRIPTWMPPPNLGTALAKSFEAGSINYDRYIGLACLDISVEQSLLIDRLSDLISSPAKRAQMGHAGQKRARGVYDWRVVMKQHLSLWNLLEQLRQQAILNKHPALRNAPVCYPARQDPYQIFGCFPTHLITGQTVVRVATDHDAVTQWQSLLENKLFNYALDTLPKAENVDAFIGKLSCNPSGISLDKISQSLGWTLARSIKLVAPLAKVGIVQFSSRLYLDQCL